nr:MAG TPA: hypothetical protein [Caudoviricetes sp.]
MTLGRNSVRFSRHKPYGSHTLNRTVYKIS